jgi:GH25 family lysozyme M1 (1,4-beta-N-acetylmuramidase)
MNRLSRRIAQVPNFVVKTGFHYLPGVLAILVGINQVAAQDTVCAAGTTLPGIDVSQSNLSITWTNVKAAGIVFAYAEATDGNSHIDPYFSSNWSGMKTAGIVRGAYAVFEPNVNGTAQANYFMSVMGALQPGDLPPMLEVDANDDESAATIATNLSECIIEIEAQTGRAPIVLTYPTFFSEYVGGSTNFSSWPLWITGYVVTCPTLPAGWTNWAIWQYSGTGTVSGISGPSLVDLDEFNGSMSDLQAFANPPSLDIAHESTNEISVTWPTFAIGYLLQENPALDTTNWSSVTNTPGVVSNLEQVTLGTSTNHVYLRLFHP